MCKNNYYTKRYLFTFFYHVYLETERNMNDELNGRKNDLIVEIAEDMRVIS